MIFPIGYEPELEEEPYNWLTTRKVKFKIRWSFHDDNYLLRIDNEEDAIAFRLTFGWKSGRTGFVYDDQK